MELTRWEAWTAPLNALAQDLAQALPRLAGALLLLLAGLLTAAALRRLLRRVLNWAGVDESLSDVFLFRVWSRSHQGQSPTQALSGVAAYACLFLFGLAALRVLGGTMGQQLLEAALRLVPSVLSVLLILLLAALMASFVSLVIQLALQGSGIRHAVFWGKAAAWGTFGAGVLFSLEPLGLAGQVLTNAALIILAGAALAGGLAFGLGCKDLARETLLELLSEGKGGPEA